MNKIVNIELVGTLSSKYSYIKHVLRRVIQRSGISVQWEEVNDLSSIIDRNIEVVPTLFIDDRAFSFNSDHNVNLILKDAMLFLLRSGGFQSWPFFIVAGRELMHTQNPFLFAYYLAIQFEAAIEVNDLKKDSVQSLSNPFPLYPEHNNHNFKDSDHQTILSSILSEPLIGTYENALMIEEIRSLLPHYQNATALIVSKDHPNSICEEPDCLIRRAVDGGRVSVIFTSEDAPQEALKHITLIAHSEKEAFQLPLLNDIINVFSAKVKVVTSPVAVFSHTQVVPGGALFENEVSTQKAHTNIIKMIDQLERKEEEADLYAFQLKNHHCLERLIQDEQFIQWFEDCSVPILFLPFK